MSTWRAPAGEHAGGPPRVHDLEKRVAAEFLQALHELLLQLPAGQAFRCFLDAFTESA
jgi:hypothetical protein